MLEPQGTLFLILLLLAFGGLITWVALAGQVVFRVIAACLAFIPAMVFGIAAVNKYYDYYQTWGALYSDLSGQTSSIPHLTAAGLGKGTAGSVKGLIAGSSDSQIDAEYGLDFSTTITGHRSHITRQVLIYLPPQYFSKAYANYKFPVIELLQGSPGHPSDWVNVMNIVPIYLAAMSSGKADPAVLVMPDTDGGQQYGLQCLNDTDGLQDMTYVAREVPDWVAANLRVQKPGAAWGIAGYSEGGFCAANIALQDPALFGYAGSLSGYFSPVESQVPANGKPGGKPIDVFEYAHNKKLLALNSPDDTGDAGAGHDQRPAVLPRGRRHQRGRRPGRGDLQAGAVAQGRRRAAGHRPRRRAPGHRLAGGADPDARLDDTAARAGGPADRDRERARQGSRGRC